MPAIRMLGEPRLKLRRTYTLAGQEFLVLTANRENGRETVYHGPAKPYNVQFGHYLGQAGWVALQVREGDRPYGDSLLVDRIGLDGWIDPFPPGDRVLKAKFSVVFQSGCAADGPGQWLNFFEIHAIPIRGSGEFEGAGPINLSYEWSAGASAPIFRAYKRLLTYDANGLATGNTQEIIYQSLALSEGVKYDFEVQMYCNDTNGFLHIWWDNVKIVDLNDQAIGYGVERRPYPQFRMYRATRANIGKLMVKVDEISAERVPPLPGVTRGPELIRDGQFMVGPGAWTDVDSDPGCSMEWVSDGAGGGYMRSSTLWPDDRDSNARFKRRLDILEVGEIYELKHSGTFGLGVGTTDGGYWNAATRLLPPKYNEDGSEVVRQFVARTETIFLGSSNAVDGSTLDGVSLKRVIVP